jgi:O-antigen/teichoic acid export membrane protein
VKLPISKKFQKDVWWNLVSLVVLSISGLAINILVGRFYGASTLGFFNQTYAVYILGSQLAVGSVHLSLQKYVAETTNQKKLNQIITPGLMLAACFALGAALLIYLTRFWVARFLSSPDVAIGIYYIVPGLILFAFNKTLIGILNGLRQMKAFAFFQGLRYLLMVGFIVYLIATGAMSRSLPLAFSYAEAVLFVGLFAYTKRYFGFIGFKQWQGGFGKHFQFSYHSLGGNILADVNTRVDVLILGYFLSDQKVGIYSFAAILAEGFSQILVVLKHNVNPVLANLSGRKRIIELADVVRQGVKLTYKYAAILGIVAIALYPLLLKMFTKGDFSQSIGVFAILMGGIILSSGYQPFQMLLAQAGYPKYYTLLVAIVFVANVVLNVMLIPVWGIYGSAAATGVSFVISAGVLRFLTKKTLKVTI